MIGGLQLMLHYLIYVPILQIQNLDVQLGDIEIILLSLSTVLIAAGGNIINDYFDLKIDRINRPNKLFVGKYIHRRGAMASHLIMTVAGVLMGAYVAVYIGAWEMGFVQIIGAGLLWFYSTDFKRRFLLGNLTIASCVALVPLTVALYEIPALVENYTKFLSENPEHYGPFLALIKTLMFWALGLSLFAFMLTLAREITKDIIDKKGDFSFGCKTLPIVLGVKKSVYVITALYIISILLLISAQQLFLPDRKSMFYMVFLVSPLIGLSAFFTLTSKKDKDFKLPSLLNKIASAAGMAYLFLAHLELLKMLEEIE
jgi:4-hydroxybenzoate polyprenyltransferase